MNRTIYVNPVEPASLSIRHPRGINLDLLLTMRGQTGAPVVPSFPQFVLLPRGNGGIMSWDMDIIDPVNGIAGVNVPGTQLTDSKGYTIEIYSRVENEVPSDPMLPTGLLATGALITQGTAYAPEGPFNMINVPVVVGPQGEQGPQGTRGSIWLTGDGDPVDAANEGDMYLDNLNGNVWRYGPAGWTQGTF